MTEHRHTNPNLFPENPQPGDRQAVLDAFAEQPDNTDVWETAYEWVRAEGDTDSSSPAGDIPAEELITMADLVCDTDPADRYALMTRTASNDKLWFDVIEGFSFSSIRDLFRGTIGSFVEQQGGKFHNALDLGTGTGKTLEVLEQNAEHVVGVDRNANLLGVAKHRAASNVELVQADVTQLPFGNDSFDLVTSVGLEGALDKEARTAYYTEIARVLVPGGNYLTAFVNYPEMPSEEMEAVTNTSKAMLADMICDTVSGGAAITEHLGEEETLELLASLDLHREYYLMVSENEKTHAILQMITKDH